MSLRGRLTATVVALVLLGVGLALGATFGAVTEFGESLPAETYVEVRNRVARVAVISAVAAIAGVALLSWWLVGRALRPLRGIAATADAIGDGELSLRVEPADRRTEVGRVGFALNAMLGQLESAFERRRESEERLRRFVADASHELRTPLTSIRGYAELFGRGADTRPDDLAAAMSRIQAESERMSGLVEELLLLARLDDGQLDGGQLDGGSEGQGARRTPVDLGALARDAVADARVADPQRRWDLTVEELAEEDPAGAAPWPVGDEDQLRRVVANLLANVTRHTPVGTTATVRVRRTAAEVVITVADDGPGLDAEQRERAFERFYRGDPSRSRSGAPEGASDGAHDGAGLGLAIVAAVAAAHGGTAAVESVPGHGASFTVRLPSAG